MKIHFVTGNSSKFGEAKLACDKFGIEVIQSPLSLDEIQSDDPHKVSETKAKSAFQQLKLPLVVTDTFWNIPAIGGFPGAYMKEVAQWFQADDFLSLIRDKSDKRIMFSENITYVDKTQAKHFSKEYWGQIVPPRGGGRSIEKVAEFEGYTLGERREQGTYSHTPEDYVWYEFANWYTKKL
jgi:non-canonical purine NTP pyrophosphatase (RdgB/HAM1 family)